MDWTLRADPMWHKSNLHTTKLLFPRGLGKLKLLSKSISCIKNPKKRGLFFNYLILQAKYSILV